MPTTINGTTGVSLVANNATINTPAISGGTLTSSTLVTPTISGTVTGLSAASLPAGSVVQVVQGSYATMTSSTSSTYSDTGLTASITPTSASNKILVFSTILGCMKQLSNTKIGLRLVRGSTTIDTFSTETGRSTDYGANAQVDVGTISAIMLDSPATTSSTTYKIQLASVANTSGVYINNVNAATVGSTLTLMEIKV